jgi:hypothetical protein
MIKPDVEAVAALYAEGDVQIAAMADRLSRNDE